MNGFQKLAHVLGGPNKSEANAIPKEMRLELATVQTPPPNLSILIDGINKPFGKDFLMIAEHLTRHSRIVTIIHEEQKERNLGDKTEKDLLDTDDDSPSPELTKFTYSFVELKFEDVLKKGDRVLVASVGSRYYIIDRVVRP